MSAGNAAAAIGLANSNKIPPLGGYVQDVHTNPGESGPAANGDYAGMNGSVYYTYNALGELVAPDFLAPSNSGVAAGKDGQWVTTGASPMTVAADGLCAVTAGVVTALATTGAYETYLPAATVVPAGAYLWVFVV